MLAIIALCGGLWWGASWLDPVMGLVGAALVGIWAVGLLRQTGRVLLDAEMDAPVVEEIRAIVAAAPEGATLRDLHVWRVGQARYVCMLSLHTEQPLSADEMRRRLSIHEELVHITVEISQRGEDGAGLPATA